MKKYEVTSTIVDSVYALLQTVLFAVLPNWFAKFSDIGFSYIILIIFQLLYLCFLREIIIDTFVHPDGVSTEYLLKTNGASYFRKELLAKIVEIKNAMISSEVTIFDEYIIYLKWKESADYVIQHFLEDYSIKNVVKEQTNGFSQYSIYKNELLEIVTILINAYNHYHKFEKSIAMFNCKNLFEKTCDKEKLLENMQELLQMGAK
ncbi:MAG: hypothetical protein IKL47_12245 [Clostridia bacterium]|nr:hypothetical protein [Clostridia bacterium]